MSVLAGAFSAVAGALWLPVLWHAAHFSRYRQIGGGGKSAEAIRVYVCVHVGNDTGPIIRLLTRVLRREKSGPAALIGKSGNGGSCSYTEIESHQTGGNLTN